MIRPWRLSGEGRHGSRRRVLPPLPARGRRARLAAAMSERSWVGRKVPRKEGRDKVTGAARYVDGLVFPGLLHGATVRSPAPRGRIRAITFGPGIPWAEFTVVTAKDIPGANHLALILHDQPFLAADVVNHAEEPVLRLAHEDRHLLEEARRAVRLEI